MASADAGPASGAPDPGPSFAALQGQLSLFGDGAPRVGLDFAGFQRRELAGGAYVDYAPGWLAGHTALLAGLVRSTHWRTLHELMYERMVQVPRLVALLPADGPGDPVLETMRRALEQRYQTEFMRTSLALYRDGRDSVAWHGDRVARTRATACVATVSLGSPRRFLLRPRGGGSSVAYNLGWGDLLVMGGSCQRTWQHCVPKASHAEPRLAIMFRNFEPEP